MGELFMGDPHKISRASIMGWGVSEEMKFGGDVCEAIGIEEGMKILNYSVPVPYNSAPQIA